MIASVCRGKNALKVDKLSDLFHMLLPPTPIRERAHRRAKVQMKIILLQIKSRKPMQVLAHSKAVQNASFAIRNSISKRIVQNSRNAEAKLYNPQSRKLDLKTISCFFIGYPKRSKGYRFYCPSHSTRIVETRHAEFLENANNSGSSSFRRIEVQEARDETPIIYVPIPINTPLDTSTDHLIAQDHPNNPTNFDDYYTYLNEADFDLRKCNDPESFEDAITCDQSAHWREAIEDELNSMSKNNVWELAELPKGAKPVGCKWVYKTKLEPNGNVERYKGRLVAKGYTQKEGIDYKETFSFVSRKDSLRIVMALKKSLTMKFLGDASYVIDIEINRDDANGRLGLTKRHILIAYSIGFNMETIALPHVAPALKGDIFGSHQCPKTEVEYEEMK
ncbi:putative RNA-directed DNA polymerase [Tanacetum coccineum]|uniref:RNA-directed DNA polymerase n=1 Tax=Tanacetum coccineum TaxID=301880 RepID=A0ABQ5CKF6_9ASTR